MLPLGQEPRVIMPDSSNRSLSGAHRRDYIWQYEYYDDEEPVSFEGLKANRYSIVIGFWVGLAVFIFFLFIVLALLTKTRAPHQANPESADVHHRPNGCLVDSNSPQDENAPFTRPLLSRSQSYSHFHIQEELPQGSCHPLRGGSSSRMDNTEDLKQPLHGHADGVKPEWAYVLFTQVNVPNFVSLDHSSAVGEDKLQYEPSVVLVQQDHRPDAHCDIH